MTLAETVRLENPDYLLLYLDITKAAEPGTMKLTFAGKKGKPTVVDYQLKKRDRKGDEYAGFDASDVLYLIMPDRFAKGDTIDDATKCNTLQYPTVDDRKNPNSRHGGDIEGMRRHLGYIDSLGVTAVWVNPVLTNDMPGGAYHGYATTDYYNIDPRFGSNEEWRKFVADAHKRDIKVVMDMIFNHSGSNHRGSPTARRMTGSTSPTNSCRPTTASAPSTTHTQATTTRSAQSTDGLSSRCPTSTSAILT